MQARKSARYTYGCQLSSTSVMGEWLFAYPNNRQTELFRRAEDRFTFGRGLSGSRKSIESLTKSRTLFLSVAALSNHEHLLPIYHWFERVLFIGADKHHLHEYAASRLEAPETRDRAARLLSRADLGIVGLHLERQQYDDDFKKMLRLLRDHGSARAGRPMARRRLLRAIALADRGRAGPCGRHAASRLPPGGRA